MAVQCDVTQHSLPRILCLHGGGSNARIFHKQCRVIRAELKGLFNFIFADGPFLSEPGPDVTSVFKEFAPFRSWLEPPYNQHFNSSSSDSMVPINRAIAKVMQKSDANGDTGEWVAVLGFSQGARVAASLLAQQKLQNTGWIDANYHSSSFQFAILLAGSPPLLPTISSAPFGHHRQHNGWRQDEGLPTIHVHGLKDPGLHRHRSLFSLFSPDEAVLVEWDGSHRVPIKSVDVAPLVQAVIEVAQSVRVL